jgi:hypothetical protein
VIAFLKSESQGMIKLCNCLVQQNNQTITIFRIGNQGRLSVENSLIEWDHELNYQQEFSQAERVHIQNVTLNNIRLRDFDKP